MASAVIVCRAGAEPAEESEAALTLGRKVATALGADLHWVLLGPAPEAYTEVARRHGVAAVDLLDDAKLAAGGADAAVEALAQYWQRHPGKVMILAQTFDARLVAPRVAGRCHLAVVTNARDIDVADGGGLDVVAAAYGGDTNVVYATEAGRPCVVTLQANAVVPEPAATAAAEPSVSSVEVDLSGVEERIRVLEPARSEGPRLEDADVIVAGGRGLKSEENFALVAELAEVLGGIAGASRPLVDEGWIGPAHQVGLTGKITHPGLYLAAGISGATQHMVGCTAAKTIVAINTDPDAAIFRHCRYGIVGDAVEILPELIRVSKEAGLRR